MKNILFFFCFLFIADNCFANLIDSLKTNEEVNAFLVKKVNRKWKGGVLISEDKNQAAQFGKNKFFKIDLDGNGETDLVVDGVYLIIVFDKGNNKYSTRLVDGGPFLNYNYSLVNILHVHPLPLIVLKKNNPINDEIDINSNTDTLIYKAGNLIEYNEFVDNIIIEQISVSTTMCFGKCPVFEMVIDSNRNVTYNAKQFNKEKGNFSSKIDTALFNKLIETIKYLKLDKLKDSYLVNWTDDQTINIEIKYNNGRLKKISDYGMVGTFGLRAIYGRLFYLKETQKWKRVKKE